MASWSPFPVGVPVGEVVRHNPHLPYQRWDHQHEASPYYLYMAALEQRLRYRLRYRLHWMYTFPLRDLFSPDVQDSLRPSFH